MNREYIIKNLIIIDGKQNIPEKNKYIRISGNMIAEVGDMAEYIAAENINEYDGSGYYVMPGLVDAHIHMVGGRGSGDYGDTEILTEPAPVRYMRSVYEAQKMLKHGFTMVRDISWNSLYMKRIFHDDVMPGPKVIACGPGLARSGGHSDSPQFPWRYVKENHFWAVISDGRDECIRNVRRVLREGADQIKFWATGGGNWGTDRITDTHYSFEEMKAICDEAHMIKGTLVCAHCETEETIRMAIEAGVDTIEHGEDLTEELADIMVEKNIILVPTLFLLANWYDLVETPGVTSPKLIRPDVFLYRDVDIPLTQEEKDRYKKQVIDSFRLAMKKGVKIALGSDTVYEPSCEYGQQSYDEFAELVKRGMTLPQAVRSATFIAAEACGMSHITGEIKEGKAADMLFLRKNPLESVEILTHKKNIEYVVVDGRLAVDHGRLAW